MSTRVRWILILFALLILFSIGSLVNLYTDLLWFKEVGYSSVFWMVLLTKIKVALTFGAAFFIFLYGNILLARALAPKYRLISEEDIARKLEEYFFTLAERYRIAVDRFLNLILLLAALFLSFLVGAAATDMWDTVLRYFNRVPFKLTDPVFYRDIGFYVFSLPLYQYLYSWALFTIVVTLLAVGFIHLYSGAIQLKKGVQIIIPVAKAHLSILGALIFLVVAWGYRLNAYLRLFTSEGIITGASYADINARLPVLQLLIVVSVICSALLLININLSGWRLPLIGVGLLILTSFFAGAVYPGFIQQYRVLPNEIAKERPYINRNIQYTQQAYGLDKVKEQEFAAKEELTAPDIEKNRATVDNIRLWDWRPLKKTYAQLQSMRLYYNFNDVDLDRYFIDGDYRQVTLSARELNLERLPASAKTWVNEHLVFTHGYGLVMNAVTTVTKEGLPELIIKDIPPVSNVPAFQLKRPEIYYGEETRDYVIVKTGTKEFDYPKGDKNVYSVYKGRGGVPIESALRKTAFAWRFGSLKLLLSDAVTAESRVMFYRQINERVGKLAPFLAYDKDPYIVTYNGRLFWIIDAYTLSDKYPYSKPFNGGNNYIRNSVKVVIDAYNGDLLLYVVDKEDPIIKTYQKIFPNLFKSFEQMPVGLKKHIRYPQDLFMIQAQTYSTYHMRDPQVFYNKEDLWATPSEIYDQGSQPMEPYYVVMKLPGAEKEEFLLMLPFVPSEKNNMIAWLSAKSDLPQYGNLLLYKLPKRKLIFGPMQIEARVDQDPEISKQLTLWGQRGSRVIRGNLLVIPVEESFIYVEPLYLQSEQSELPELKRVVVAYGNRIAMEENLETALLQIFTGRVAEEKPAAATATISDLVKSAAEHFNKAQEFLKQGDWSAYGEELKKLEQALNDLKAKAK